MTRFHRLLRLAKGTGLVLIGLVALAATLIWADKWALRWRAERLLRDFQAIELHKTPWTHAEVLMRRWGAWGHYDGGCTEQNCQYTITLSDYSWLALSRSPEWAQHAIFNARLFLAYQALGGRAPSITAGFLVQDGTIRRTFFSMTLDVPPHVESWDDTYGYELIVHAQSRSSLNREARERDSRWILGDDEQLAEHPYYKGGRPGGCEICMAAEVTYSVATPQAEIRRLTGFDLSCITRWWPCTRVEQLMPAAKPWHLYQLEGDPPEPEPAKAPPAACTTPVWALGRDAINVYSVEAQSAVTEKSEFDGHPYQVVRARLTQTIKGETPWPPGSVLTILPYSGEFQNPPLQSPETMEIGHRYLALVRYRYAGFEARSSLIDHGPGISLDRCGVLDDTPANRAELARGIAMNDELRVPEF